MRSLFVPMLLAFLSSLLGILLLLATTYLGLLLIGSLLANPLGPNRESFAVCHFINYTCTSSLEAVSVDRKARSVTIDGRVPEATEQVCRGRSLVLFVTAEKA